MNSRERVLTALNHQEPDRVPLYFGGTSSFLTDTAYYKLKEYLGIHGDVEPYRTGHTGNIFDQRILEALDVDVRFVVMKIGIDVRRVDEHTILSDWGIPLRKVDGYGVRTGPPFSDIDVEKEGEEPSKLILGPILTTPVGLKGLRSTLGSFKKVKKQL